MSEEPNLDQMIEADMLMDALALHMYRGMGGVGDVDASSEVVQVNRNFVAALFDGLMVMGWKLRRPEEMGYHECTWETCHGRMLRPQGTPEIEDE